jgi:hypothetical protein
MSKARQRYPFAIRRGKDGGYAIELSSEPRPSLGGLDRLFDFTHLYIAEDAKQVGEIVTALLEADEVDKEAD